MQALSLLISEKKKKQNSQMRRAFFVVHHFEEPHRKSFKTPPLPALLLLNQLHVSQKRETSMKDDSVSIFIVIQWFSSLIFNLLQCI